MKRVGSRKELPDSALRYVLEGLIPYTDANIKLAFKPNLFFNDLERIDKQKQYKKQTLKKAYYRAIRQNLIHLDHQNIPRLTAEGQRKLKPFKPKRLSGSKLMVIFDIPETERTKRRHLRLLLKELRFTQAQKSVWVSQYDSRDYLREEIKRYDLEKHVEVYESRKLTI